MIGQLVPVSSPAALVMPPPDTLRLVACPRPFSQERTDLEIPAGGTVADMVAAFVPEPALRRLAHVWLADREMRRDPEFIHPELWNRVRPKPGIVVTIRVSPEGGEGGGKNVLAIVLSIAVLVVAAYVGWALAPAVAGFLGTGVGFTEAVLTTGIATAGPLVVNALEPPA